MKQVWVKIAPWNKELALAAIESGADAVWVEERDTARVKELGRITTIAENGDLKPGMDFLTLEIASKEDEVRAATAPRDKRLLLHMRDWTIIPLENLLAQREGLMAEARSLEEARTLLGILEKGVDGVLVNNQNPVVARQIIKMVHAVSSPLELLTATVTRIIPTGMGDRVCVDTCSAMAPGEGMLVGNTSSAFFLVHSESLENPYVAARPFRVNASAVHAYILRPDDRTSYLSDLRTGDAMLVVNARGQTRVTHLGRSKIEARPMLLVQAEVNQQEISIVLQNAETINLVRPDGQAVSVSRLQTGDQVLVHLQSGGRHFGMKISETLTEK